MITCIQGGAGDQACEDGVERYSEEHEGEVDTEAPMLIAEDFEERSALVSRGGGKGDGGCHVQPGLAPLFVETERV